MEYHEGVQGHGLDGAKRLRVQDVRGKEADRLGKHETFGYYVGSGGFCI